MAIEFNCPHCDTFYRLKDEFAGKRANCKNPECCKVITIPQPKPNPVPAAGPSKPPETGTPGARGTNGTGPTQAEIEAAALSALNDAPKEDEPAPVEQVISLQCAACEHKWTVPFAMAGKNVLCPECRQRMKVPELKKDQINEDWRKGRSNLPSLAKENFEKPKDVQDAGDVRIVTQKAMKEAGAIDEGIEPRPLKQKILFVMLALGLVGGIVFGVVYLVGSRKENKEQRLVDDALKEFTDSGVFAKDEKEYADSRGAKGPAATGSLYAAMLHIAAGEYALRMEKPEELKKALDSFARARDEIRQAGLKDDPRRPTIAERNALVCELAVATVNLGGDAEQINDGVRYRWLPEAPTGRALRVNEKIYAVHSELQKTLQLILGSDFDLRANLARRLTREMMKLKHADLATELPILMFTEPEQAEAKAIIALEIFRADKTSEKPRQMAEELKTQVSGTRNPVPASAQTLWLVLTPPVEKTPTVVGAPPTGQQPVTSDASRYAYVGLWLLQGKPEEALALAQRAGGSPAGQLRALALVADWAADPGPALTAAANVLKNMKPDAAVQSTLLRLAQIAGAAGKTEEAKTFAESIGDEGLRAWARADAFRLSLKPDSKATAEENAIEVPTDPAKLRLGHAWARMWIARHNTRITGDAGKQTKAISLWEKGSIHPFGLAGIALGLKDQ